MSEVSSKMALVERLLRVALSILAIVLLGVAVLFGFRNNAAGLTAAALSATVCLIFIFLPRFSEIDILGFKAKLLDQKILEADDALTNLKRLTVIVARAAYQSLIYGNRMTSIPLEKKQALVNEIDDVAKNLSIKPSELEDERSKFIHVHIFDVALIVEAIVRLERQYLDEQAKIARNSKATNADAWTAIETGLKALSEKLDVQRIFLHGEVEEFFESLKFGIKSIDFSPAPERKKVLLTIVDEAFNICKQAHKLRILTPELQKYLATYDRHEGARLKLSETVKTADL